MREINELEEEEERMVSKMRRELGRMEAVNRELERRLFVETPRVKADIGRLRADLSSERLICADLRRELALAVGRSARLAQLLERNANVQRAQTADYETELAELRQQIKWLNSLLVSKTKSRSIGPTAVRLSAAHSSQWPQRPLHIQRRTHSGDQCSLHIDTSSTDNLSWTPAGGEDQRQPPSLNIDGTQTAGRRRKECVSHRQKLLQIGNLSTVGI